MSDEVSSSHSNNTSSFLKFSEVAGLPVSNFTNYSRINNSTVWINDMQHHALDVSLIDVDESVADNLSFSWECIDFTETEMVMQMYFENPSFVSSSSNAQSLRLVFILQEVFQDTDGKVIRPMLELRGEIPRQID